jgi:hypothetical protein
VHLPECAGVVLRRHVRRDGGRDAERRARALRGRRAEALDQRVPLQIGFRIAALPRQPGAPLDVIDDDRPVVDADRHVRNALVVARAARQVLDAAGEVVAEIAYGAAAERQSAGGCARIHREMTAQQREGIFARQRHAVGMHFGQLAARDQPHVRARRDDVVARLRDVMVAAVEEDGPRAVGHGLEQRGAVRPVRQLGQQRR